MKRLAIVLMAGGLLGGCFEQDKKPDGLAKAQKDVRNVHIANNSPDMTVKSWWALKDAGIKLSRELCLDVVRSGADLEKGLASLASSDLGIKTECRAKRESYERSIDAVDVQSETRAVVTASIRNTTAPDDGASLDSAESAGKEKGSQFRYVLERPDVKSGWIISGVTEKAYYSSSWTEPFKKAKPYNFIYVNSNNQ